MAREWAGFARFRPDLPGKWDIRQQLWLQGGSSKNEHWRREECCERGRGEGTLNMVLIP